MCYFGAAVVTPDAPLSGLSILLLEDEFLIALDAQDILMELGAAQVEVVNTLDAARVALERPQFDLALLDINVNGEMSFPVAEQFAVRNVPVVFASGYELREPPRLNGTPAFCLSKPYTTENLKQALLSTLAARRES
jgi:CheY-like chemotaxis protein